MSCVLPGVTEIFASFELLHNIFINDDLPTLLLPMNAYSGLSGFGHLSNDGLEIRYVAFVICIFHAKKQSLQRRAMYLMMQHMCKHNKAIEYINFSTQHQQRDCIWEQVESVKLKY